MTKLHHPNSGKPANVADGVADQWRQAGWLDAPTDESETTDDPDTKTRPRRKAKEATE